MYMNVTQLIGDEYKQWTTDDIITIKAGTGQGKSYFIMNTLYEHAKINNEKILFLIHRTNCVDQFKYELETNDKTDTIHIRTYQHLESNINFNFSKYKYIVSDEFHYFIGDASFNPQTDISFNSILQQDHAIKIYMSATGEHVTKFLSKVLSLSIKDYSLPIEYNFIDNLNFFYKKETLQLLVKESVNKNIKTIIFLDSAKQAYELHKKYKKVSLFNCSKSNKLYKYVKKDEIKEMLHNEKFNQLLLFTTTCMDAGVNLKDKSLTRIICDIRNTHTLIQCLGRKRMLDSEDQSNVYIQIMNNNVLGGIYKQANDRKERAKYLKKHTLQEYILKYGRKQDMSQIIYDVPIEGESDKLTKKVNELMYYKYLFEGLEVDMIKTYQFGHGDYLSSILKKDKFTFMEKELHNMKLEEYLNSIVDKKLFKEEQTQLKEIFKQNGLSARTLGINTLNGNLKDRELPFIIISKRTNTSRYWEVINNIDN